MCRIESDIDEEGDRRDFYWWWGWREGGRVAMLVMIVQLLQFYLIKLGSSQLMIDLFVYFYDVGLKFFLMFFFLLLH
jgi:hypothetical protein